MNNHLCPSCHYRTYAVFPYWIFNENNQKVKVWGYHCFNCGWEPEKEDIQTEWELPQPPQPPQPPQLPQP